jgi:tetratricopeptide (TPR) repeat protein
MLLRDVHGNATTGATCRSLAHYEHALRLFQCYVGDPLAVVEAALRACPELVMGHALKAYLHLFGTDPAGLAMAREAHAAAAGLPANPREAGHVRAIGQLLERRWYEAGRTLAEVTAEFPRDALALQAGHLIDFLRGDARMLHDRIDRALPAWDKSRPGYHAVLGMHALGLEETGEPERAEAEGRRAVELEPRDAWARHAVAHVLQAQRRSADGIAWMRADSGAWSRDSFFCAHNWWHLAQFHLTLGEVEEAAALHDGPLRATRPRMVFDLVDAPHLAQVA